MRKRLLLIIALITLVAVALVGCSEGGSPCSSTLTILSISEGDVFVMEAGTDSWEEAQGGMSLEI
jgi:ABC-type glycerol-3-phosphate transport system substrate-binding protein